MTSPFYFDGVKAVIVRAITRVGQSVTVRFKTGAADLAGTLTAVDTATGTLTITDAGTKVWTVPVDGIAAITT